LVGERRHFHCEDGRLADYSEQEIESIANWWGKPGVMLPAMKTARFMDSDEHGWFMVSWDEHQGHIAAYKIKGKAMAEARWGKLRGYACSIPVSNTTRPPPAMPYPAEPTKPAKPTNQASLNGARADIPVELPQGFPKSPDDAIRASEGTGCGAIFATDTWNKAVSRGGCDSKGQPIRSFAHYVATEWKYQRERLAKTTNGSAEKQSGVDLIIRQNELKEIEAKRKAIRDSYADHQRWTIEDTAEYGKLGVRRKELRAILGYK
jgi:hypothetical protein